MTERAYKNISIKNEFAEEIERFIRQNPRHGYRSIAAFLEDSSRRRLEELRDQEIALPRMEQVNFDDKGVKILDRQIHRVADIYFNRDGVHCNIDETGDCEHIKFAVSLPEVRKIMRKHRKEGWKLPDV